MREQCLSLPYLDRLNLCEELINTILQERREKRPPHPNRCQILLEKMGQILGEPVQFKSRESKFVWARTMVAYQLTQEGFSPDYTAATIHKGTTEHPVSLGGEFPDCSQCEMGKESGEIRTPGDL